MIRYISLTFLLSVSSIANATDSSLSRFDECLTRIEKGFFETTGRLIKEITQQREEIATSSVSLTSSQLPNTSNTLPMLPHSLEQTALQGSEGDHLGLLINRLKDQTSSFILSLHQEKTALNQQLMQLKEKEQVRPLQFNTSRVAKEKIGGLSKTEVERKAEVEHEKAEKLAEALAERKAEEAEVQRKAKELEEETQRKALEERLKKERQERERAEVERKALEESETQRKVKELEEVEAQRKAKELEEETQRKAKELEEAETQRKAKELEEAERQRKAKELEAEAQRKAQEEILRLETERKAKELEEAETQRKAKELEETERQRKAKELEEAEAKRKEEERLKEVQKKAEEERQVLLRQDQQRQILLRRTATAKKVLQQIQLPEESNLDAACHFVFMKSPDNSVTISLDLKYTPHEINAIKEYFKLFNQYPTQEELLPAFVLCGVSRPVTKDNIQAATHYIKLKVNNFFCCDEVNLAIDAIKALQAKRKTNISRDDVDSEIGYYNSLGRKWNF